MLLEVKKVRLEINQVFSVDFKKPKGFNFYPGQFLDIQLKPQDTRPFSISSSPTERKVTITVKKGVTKFKKTMANLKPGATITTTHPIGTFTLDTNYPAVFIAGGIGITPFRSMVKYCIDKKITIPILLIYSNSDENFVFKKELDKWQSELKNFKLIYLNTSNVAGLNRMNLKFLILNSKFLILNSVYYIAGSPQMVDDFKKILIQMKVSHANIRTDAFLGY